MYYICVQLCDFPRRAISNMIRNWLRRVMAGRYGPDQLYFALFITALIIGIVASATGLAVLSGISYVLLIIAIFRALSRNIYKRRAENDKFLRFWWPVKMWFKGRFTRVKSMKTHKFYNCPGCRNVLRVPRGKGKIQITCPKCGQRFVKKT